MSLYIFGIIATNEQDRQSTRENLSAIAEHAGACVIYDTIDVEDQKILIETVQGTGGIFFTVCSSPVDTDAISLWHESGRAVVKILDTDVESSSMILKTIGDRALPAEFLDTMKDSVLGEFLMGLIGLPYYNRTGIAAVDGGVENVYRSDAQDCITRLLKMTMLPWDCIDNTVYVWDRPATNI